MEQQRSSTSPQPSDRPLTAEEAAELLAAQHLGDPLPPSPDHAIRVPWRLLVVCMVASAATASGILMTAFAFLRPLGVVLLLIATVLLIVVSRTVARIRRRRAGMANGNYLLPSGRQVRLVRLHIDGTYEGVLCGNAATATPVVRESVDDDVAALMPPGRPLVTIGAGGTELPPHRVIAQLECRRAVRTADPDFGSRLFACWFIGDLAGTTIDMLVAAALKGIDWEAQADDFDVTLI